MKRDHKRNLLPLLASTGRMPNTMSAYKPPVLSAVSFSYSNIALKRSTRGSTLSARASTDNPSPCAWS